jgi:CheY-like chemotaxis protein
VILLDINLPDMDGFAVLQLLRQNEKTRKIPVIALTANAMQENVQKGLEAGFHDYITKPIEIPVLLNALENALSLD